MATKKIDLGLVQGPSGITPEFSINEEGELIAHYDQGLPIVVKLDNDGLYASQSYGLVMIPGFVTDEIIVRGGSYITVVVLNQSIESIGFDSMDPYEKVAFVNDTSNHSGIGVLENLALYWVDESDNVQQIENLEFDSPVCSFILKSDDMPTNKVIISSIYEKTPSLTVS